MTDFETAIEARAEEVARARHPRSGAPPPRTLSGASGAAPGALRAPRRGVQRRSRKSARTSESLCVWRFFLFYLRPLPLSNELKAQDDPLHAG